MALKTCAGGSKCLLPACHDGDQHMSMATLNRVTIRVSDQAPEKGLPLEPFTVYDLRRSGSTLLNEVDFNRDWIVYVGAGV